MLSSLLETDKKHVRTARLHNSLRKLKSSFRTPDQNLRFIMQDQVLFKGQIRDLHWDMICHLLTSILPLEETNRDNALKCLQSPCFHVLQNFFSFKNKQQFKQNFSWIRLLCFWKHRKFWSLKISRNKNYTPLYPISELEDFNLNLNKLSLRVKVLLNKSFYA